MLGAPAISHESGHLLTVRLGSRLQVMSQGACADSVLGAPASSQLSCTQPAPRTLPKTQRLKRFIDRCCQLAWQKAWVTHCIQERHAQQQQCQCQPPLSKSPDNSLPTIAHCSQVRVATSRLHTQTHLVPLRFCMI